MSLPGALLGLLILTSPAADSESQTIETLRMREIERVVKPGTLVVFDIDNTLIQPTQMLGSDQWFYALLDEIRRSERIDEERAVDRAMAIWNAVQADTDVQPVEADTPALIRRLAARKIPTLALTARTFDIADVTTRQLRSVDIDFKRNAVARDLELELSSPAKLIDGIMYVGERNAKGEVLIQLLRRTQLTPGRIVFVDDKAKNVASVSGALRDARIPFVAFRYGGADERVAAFQPEVAAIQFRWWRKIITDDAARDLRDPNR